MKISIITICYNSEFYIRDCIHSVLSQSYSDIEYILIDGSSKDNTLKIINEYKDKIDIFLSESDSGIYEAINKGISLSSGEIIGVLNSDDFFADNHVISRMVTSFQENKELDAIYADVQFVERNSINKVVRNYSSRFFKTWMFRFGFQPAHPTFYAKRELFGNYGYYRTDLKIAGDFELLLRFMKKNQIRFKYINDIWVKMRIGGVSTSGLASILKLNNEILEAHKINHLYTNKIFVYSKYLIKWWGFIKRK
jgi:glycosyltransferase involved in cell wall biosynthesis